MTLSDLNDAPGWLNWAIIGGGWVVSFLHPIALLVTIIWGTMQAITWVEKRYYFNRRK